MFDSGSDGCEYFWLCYKYDYVHMERLSYSTSGRLFFSSLHGVGKNNDKFRIYRIHDWNYNLQVDSDAVSYTFPWNEHS